MLKGLDVTVLKLSEVREENEKLRIDDGYFAKLPVSTQRQIEALPHVKFGDICDVFRKGIFDINADSYTETGVPFVRITNLRDGLIDTNDVAFIPPAAHAAEGNTALEFGDIVLSKTAYAAASLVNLPECNVSQDTIAVKLSPEGKKKFKPGFIVAYLNSRYGLALMTRQFQGNVQSHLSLPDGRKVLIPNFGEKFQIVVDKALRDANTQLLVAEGKMSEAEATLTDALGLGDWQPPEPLAYTRRASEAFAAERLDAEHFRERYAAARQKLVQAGALEFVSFGELAEILTNGHTPLHHDLTVGEVPFLCAEHITDFECHYDSDKRILLSHHTGELARTAVKSGDILLTIKGKIGNFAIAENVPAPVNINQDVALARLNDRLSKWWVVTFLNSRFGKWQAEQFCTGGINPFLGLSNVRKLTVPRFPDKLMDRIAETTRVKIQEARAARARARELLERAKRAVEIAIEHDEKAAMDFLK